MKYKKVTRSAVKYDIRDAVNYYKKISIHLAERFLSEIDSSKDFISEFPYANDVMYGNDIRLQLLKTFPYHIHYIVNEEKMQVVILAVIFGRKGDLDVSERK